MTPSSTTTSSARISWRRRSVAIGSQAIVGGEQQRQRQRLVRFNQGQADVVDDDECLVAFELVDEAAEVLVVALPLGLDLERAELRVLPQRLDLHPAVDELDVALLGELRQ